MSETSKMAAATHSSMLRAQRDYFRFLNAVGAAIQPCEMEKAVERRKEDAPDKVFLALGGPSPYSMPFKDISFTLKDGKKIVVDSEKLIDVLQYGRAQGYPPLVKLLKDMTMHFHHPPLMDNAQCGEAATDLVVTAGSQDGMTRTFSLIVNPEDYVIVQEPCYAGTLHYLNPLKVKYLSVGGDSQGMDPNKLRQVLQRWKPEDMRNETHGVPKIMYVNPNGSNPTGVFFSTERKKEIYKIAQEYNLLILEDDPYYFLRFGDPVEPTPSFLQLDTDGRVLRMDSLSKTMCGGLRIGYVSGPKYLINKIICSLESSIFHAAGPSQILVYETLKYWGIEGLLKHCESLRKFYKTKRDAMAEAANKYLKGLCEWSVPEGGMFFWFSMPQVKDARKMLVGQASSKVSVMPGIIFMPNESGQNNNFRASYSCATVEQIEQGIKYLAEMIKEEIQTQNRD